MSHQPIQLLLIEDNPGDALLIHEMLAEGLGDRFELKQADRLSTGLAHLAQGGVQLVLLDLSLPDCQGVGTVARVRTQAPEVSIVVLTGLDDETLALQALETGAQDYLVKGQVSGPLLARALRYALERHQNTQRLQENEAFIQNILNSLTSHVVVLDEQGCIVAMNEAWRLFARDHNCPDMNAYLGANYLTVTEAAVRRDGDQIAAAALRGIRAVMDGEQSSFSLEYPCHSPEEKRWFTLRVSPRNGTRRGVVIAHDNISERKRAEAQRQSFYDTLNASLNELYIFDAEMLHFEFVSAGALRNLGYRPEVLRGMTPLDLKPEFTPASFQALIEPLRRHQTPAINFETFHRRVDGSTYPVEAHLQLFDQVEHPVFLAVILDITERRRAEAALRESEVRFRSLYENSTVGLYQTTPDGRILLANPTVVRLLGYSSFDELAARNLAQNGFAPSYDRAQFLQVIERQGEVRGFEASWTRQDGTAVFIRESARAIRDPQGRTLHYDGIIEDITERKQAEAALRRADSYNRSLIEASLDPLVTITPEGKISDVNSATEQATGCTRDELVGTDFSDYFVDADKAQAGYQRVFDEGAVRDYELRLRHRQGSVMPVLYNAAVYRDEAGQVMGVFAAARDITERKQAEAALRETSERLTHMLANSPTVIYALKVEGDQAIPVWISGNIEPILGFSPNDALRPEWWPEQLHPQDRPRILASLEHLFDDHFQHDYRFLRKDGRLVWLHDEHRLLRDAGNRPREIIGAWTDITARKQAEQTLEEYSARLKADVAQRTQELCDAQAKIIRQEKMAVLGQLASSVAHELRNPLGVIANAVYFLSAVQPNADAATLDYLGLIAAEVSNADKIINDLLDFARIKGMARETVDLVDLIERVLQKHPPATNITVAIENLAPLPPLWVDSRQIEQVLTNLVVNACQAMPEGGSLTLRPAVVNDPLSAGPEPLLVALHVIDTGTGVPPENMGKLFEPLFTTKAKGIGLGLAVSKKLIEANGGKIEVQSEPGRGSTFTVFLPTAGKIND